MKLTLWAKIKKDQPGIHFPGFSRLRLLDFVKKAPSDNFKLIIQDETPPKSEEALGYYWAALLPSIIAHDRGLTHEGQIANNPLIIRDLLETRVIKKEELENLHRDIMYTFRPEIAKNILTKETGRVGQELKKYNNQQLLTLIDELLAAFEPQGYDFTDAEEYKKLKDLPRDNPNYKK